MNGRKGQEILFLFDPLAAWGPRHVRPRRLLPKGITFPASQVTIVASGLLGDANGDGKVDYVDLAILGAAYGTRKREAGFSGAADLNGDGLIDFKDLAILRAN